MILIQILLPLYNAEKEVFSNELFISVRNQLTEKFGGITVYSRSPARGLWKAEEDTTVKDDIIIYEVMAEDLDRVWWATYKKELELAFQQDLILIRFWELGVL
ncbi:hypothetical protein [Pedobacter sp. SYSU D00535]|uniref:hypothetical protein n=1 Tax=Pedobacter sp. SYSU D00535 TaxID=2810308 RepID=UPI001A97A728|nr:hypothetical protein [Pedobacter sp. SYSU D00535]